ncbi:putative Vacuolar protein sorting-associated protein 11 like protein [Glarea lozoyensis 74030]|uniref:Putative Vacuolar protein sorting-associated protein 11 like protein n=1 Tax=Glarea lozoyensis (strain ATCC 74030 / MF5533) TaxID=1104152 RepID=H0ERA7_GLAL7|nr:putative Vacuolar protein sorting-associated protein 11 like protein [Glarea lozoyensis 74030]
MALSSWKTFDFFEVSQVTPPDEDGKSFFDSNEISCEDLPNEPVLKVWALDKPVKKTGLPTCQSTEAVSVREDAIYYYGVDGRGPCYGYDGPKSLVAIYEDYVALVSPPAAATASNKPSALRRFGGMQAEEIFDTSTFTLLDTDLKFIAHSESLISQVKTLFMIWGDLFTLNQDGKFLDTQRIHNLIEYLEELHEHHKATADHTTLLLNCYAKLKDIDKLEKFIKSPGDLKFDLDTAISMCRQGGYYQQAAYLATKHGEHGLVVDILIEDSKKYAEALQYIWRLAPDAMYENLMKYARVLLEHCPSEATKLFVQYFTGHFRPKTDADDIVIQEEEIRPTGGYAAGAVTAVQNLRDLLPLPYMSTAAVASPPTQGNIEPTVGDNEIVENPQPPAPEYTAPQPRIAFSSFVDHPDEFIVFLEACLEEKDLKERDKIDLYTTLFEMFLHKSNEKRGEHRDEWEAKAKKLIEDTRGAIKALRKYGPDEPQLYPAALAYFTSDPRILEEAGDELDIVLKKIDDDGLMAPLQVIQTLSTNAVATMGMIKTYLQATIDRERKEINSNRRLITSYRTETLEKRAEIQDLTTKPQTFNATRCSFCGSQLSLPAVHFMCKHSFHATCINVQDNGEGGVEGDCTVCRKDNEGIRAFVRSQEEVGGKHDLFLDAVSRGGDRFATVSEFFGRGVMGDGVGE